MTEAAGRFVGQSVPRREDARLLTGRARFVDDLMPPGVMHAAFVRSDVARGIIRRIDVKAARHAPGVHAVCTAGDLAAVLEGRISPSLYLDLPIPLPPQRVLADGDVRFVGEPIALIIADMRYAAADAAELVEIEYDVLPAIVDFEHAADAVDRVHPELGTNVAMTMSHDDPDIEAVFASAAHVVTETFYQQRQTNAPMEPRGVLADWDPFDERVDVWLSSQNPHEARRVIARACGLPESAVRVRQQDVGGGFGQKFLLSRDELAIVLASRLLGRPVKWIEQRRENLIASTHARTDRLTCSMALDTEGTILGVRIDHLEDVGAWPVGGTGGAGTAVVTRFTGPYRIPHLSYRTTSVWTNTCGRGPYRGPWMMETTAREQMMDVVARTIGMDPLQLRRRNAITTADQPYHSPTGQVIDKVSTIATLDDAARVLDYEATRCQQDRLRAKGTYVGIGTSLFVEPQGSYAPLRVEAAVARLTPDGTVSVFVGSGAHGQGIETTMAQVVAEELDIDIDRVRIHQGDTDSTPFGAGTGGSRTGPILSAAVREASVALRGQIVRVAADLLEAAPDDLRLADGAVHVAGTPSRSTELADVARLAMAAPERLTNPGDAALEASVRHQAPAVIHSNACHMCVCEVDIETGNVHLQRYVVSEDCGVMINPTIVEGQIAGGITQGIAGALYEHFVYDGDGNPLTTSFMDYAVPSAAEIPAFEYSHVVTPADTPGGHKGMGEGGAIGAPACVMNAVADALAPFLAVPLRPPLTPANVLAAMKGWATPPQEEGAP